MRGKVKYVRRDVWYEENSSDHWSSDNHAVRYTCTYAVTYDGTEIDIDEDEIRTYYDCSRLTSNIISQLSNDLHNVWVNYEEDEDGDYCLDDDLVDLI